MGNIDIEERFVDFLLENNCYSQFVTNLLEQKRLTIEEYIAKSSSHYDIYFLVSDAFNWSITSEKGEFWALMNNRWHAVCKRLKIYL